jgi:hypothetical protein
LDLSLELFTLAIDSGEIIVGEFAPLFFDLPSRLLPISFDPIPIHGPVLCDLRRVFSQRLIDFEVPQCCCIRAMFRKESTEKSAVTVNELICDVVATSVGELKSPHVSLALQLFDDLPPVPADRVLLQQVLDNLITNAIDSMTSVPDRPHILAVRSERLDEWVLISVQDSGTGVAPEQAERLFEAFYTTKPDDIELGLSISRSIIESHGGRLSASAAQPYGSVFQVSLPDQRPRRRTEEPRWVSGTGCCPDLADQMKRTTPSSLRGNLWIIPPGRGS